MDFRKIKNGESLPLELLLSADPSLPKVEDYVKEVFVISQLTKRTLWECMCCCRQDLLRLNW